MLTICITLLSVGIGGCVSANTSSNNQTNESSSTAEETTVAENSTSKAVETTNVSNNDPISTSVEIEETKKELPALYDDVFVKYGQKINSNSASFEKVLSDMQKTNYEVNYTPPSDTEIGMIEIHDGSDFYVYIAFYPNNIEIETIMDISYGAPGAGEVSVSDNAHVTKPEYSYLIGSRTNVNSINSLREYAEKIIQ